MLGCPSDRLRAAASYHQAPSQGEDAHPTFTPGRGERPNSLRDAAGERAYGAQAGAAEQRPCASVRTLYVYTQLSHDAHASCSAGPGAVVGLNARLESPMPRANEPCTGKACATAAG